MRPGMLASVKGVLLNLECSVLLLTTKNAAPPGGPDPGFPGQAGPGRKASAGSTLVESSSMRQRVPSKIDQVVLKRCQKKKKGMPPERLAQKQAFGCEIQVHPGAQANTQFAKGRGQNFAQIVPPFLKVTCRVQRERARRSMLAARGLSQWQDFSNPTLFVGCGSFVQTLSSFRMN